MLKKILALLIATMVMALSLSVTAFASPANNTAVIMATPRYINISKGVAKLTITGGKAKVMCTVTRTAAGTESEATAVLERLDGSDWVEVQSWSSSTTSTTLTISQISSSLSRGKYRAKLYYTVYGNKVSSESSTAISNTVTY